MKYKENDVGCQIIRHKGKKNTVEKGHLGIGVRGGRKLSEPHPAPATTPVAGRTAEPWARSKGDRKARSEDPIQPQNSDQRGANIEKLASAIAAERFLSKGLRINYLQIN
jgi:hypothetical protein